MWKIRCYDDVTYRCDDWGFGDDVTVPKGFLILFKKVKFVNEERDTNLQKPFAVIPTHSIEIMMEEDEENS